MSRILELATQYAAMEADWALEKLYGTSPDYTAKCATVRDEARAALEAEVNRVEADNKRMRDALERITKHRTIDFYFYTDIARAAMDGETK